MHRRFQVSCYQGKSGVHLKRQKHTQLTMFLKKNVTKRKRVLLDPCG